MFHLYSLLRTYIKTGSAAIITMTAVLTEKKLKIEQIVMPHATDSCGRGHDNSSRPP